MNKKKFVTVSIIFSVMFTVIGATYYLISTNSTVEGQNVRKEREFENKDRTPEDLVRSYVANSKNGQFQLIKNFVSYTPRLYVKYQLEFWSKKGKSKSKPTQKEIEVESSKYLYTNQLAYKWAVEEFPQVIQHNKWDVAKIQEKKIKDNGAKLRVALEDNQGVEEYSEEMMFINEFDFYMFKNEDGIWQIFQIEEPLEFDKFPE